MTGPSLRRLLLALSCATAALLTACVIFLPGGLVSLWRRLRERRVAPEPAGASA